GQLLVAVPYNPPTGVQFYVTQIDVQGTGVASFANMATTGGPLALLTMGSAQLFGNITNVGPSPTGSFGIAVITGAAGSSVCAGCPNSQITQTVMPGAYLGADGGNI